MKNLRIAVYAVLALFVLPQLAMAVGSSVTATPITGSNGQSVNGNGNGALYVDLSSASPVVVVPSPGASTAVYTAPGATVQVAPSPSAVFTTTPAPTATTTVVQANGSVFSVSQISPAPLPSGASTAANQLTMETTLNAISAQLPPSPGPQPAPSSLSMVMPQYSHVDTFTTTGVGTTLNASVFAAKNIGIQVNATGSVTSWTVVLECSFDNSNFTTALTHTSTTNASGTIVWPGPMLFLCPYFRSHATALTLGSGTNVIAYIYGQ